MPAKDMSSARLNELVRCVEREIALRRRFYPNRVLTRRMSQAMADQQIAMMTEIGELLRALASEATEGSK